MRADGLHGLLIEHGLVGGSSVNRFPDAAAGRADVDRQSALVLHSGQRRDAAAHGGRTDVPRAKAGDRPDSNGPEPEVACPSKQAGLVRQNKNRQVAQRAPRLGIVEEPPFGSHQ